MTNSQHIHTHVALVTLLVVGLGVANWVMIPDKANTWIIGIATMAGIWIVVAAIGRARPFDEQSSSERRFLVASVWAGGLILATSLGIALAKALGVDGGAELARVQGIGAGVVLVAIGNMLPKILGPLAAQRCTPSQKQAIQRLAGWAFVLAGLSSIAAWWFLSAEHARATTFAVTLSATALVLLRCLWALASRSVKS